MNHHGVDGWVYSGSTLTNYTNIIAVKVLVKKKEENLEQIGFAM